MARETETAGRATTVPKDYLPGLAENWRNDLVSGFILFLIALPLSLGIAIASGAPPIAGVITAFIGGMLGSLLSGSYLTINGPAAGLIVIVLGAVESLGGFRFALAVGVVAGIIQVLLGLARAGKMTNLFPLSVIHGMLAGIGVIIISRQSHVALGVEAREAHGIIPFLHNLDPLLLIPESLARLNPYVAIIGLTSIVIMVLWPKLKVIGKMPAPLVAAVVGVILGAVFRIGEEGTYTALGRQHELGPAFLLDLPPGGLFGGFTSPDFSKIFTAASIIAIITYVFVASLESLLTAAAIDKLDPWKRRSDMNREFLGKGISNTVSSLVGGMPMIAEVVRSRANILSGARTRWSNFFHGFFMLAIVALFPTVLEMIPLAALAGILIVIGWRLFNPRQFVDAWRIGKEEFLFMLVTIILVVGEDLLVGVLAGFIVGLITTLVRGTSLRNLFRPRMEVSQSNDTVNVKFRGGLAFSNFMGVRGKLDRLPPGKTVILDFSEVRFVDHTVVERLEDFEGEYEREGGRIQVRGREHLRRATHHELSSLVADWSRGEIVKGA